MSAFFISARKFVCLFQIQSINKNELITLCIYALWRKRHARKTSGFQECYLAIYTRRVSRQGSPASVFISGSDWSTLSRYTEMRTHDPAEVTWRALARPTGSDMDRQTNVPQSHYVRERNAPASTGSLTATLTYYRSLTISNQRRIVRTVPLTLCDPFDANGTRVIRERFFSIRNDINPGQRLLLAFLAMFFLFSDTENRHDSAYRACAALAISGNYTPKTWDRSYCFFKYARSDVVSINL